MPMKTDAMEYALSLARENLDKGRFPVAACITLAGSIVAVGYSDSGSSSLDHAEIECLKSAEAIGDLFDAVLYTTLEPCVMCLGAARNAGISQIVFAARAQPDGSLWCVNVTKDGMPDNIDIVCRDRFIEGLSMSSAEFNYREASLRLLREYETKYRGSRLSRYAGAVVAANGDLGDG